MSGQELLTCDISIHACRTKESADDLHFWVIPLNFWASCGKLVEISAKSSGCSSQCLRGSCFLFRAPVRLPSSHRLPSLSLSLFLSLSLSLTVSSFTHTHTPTPIHLLRTVIANFEVERILSAKTVQFTCQEWVCDVTRAKSKLEIG